jgi:tRNA nucleotidyltransferase (CCA-adding enzyme)
MPRNESIAGRLLAALPPQQRAITETAVQVCSSGGRPLFVVGGAVRDVLLGRPVTDVDLVVEGPGIEVAREVAARAGVRLVTHPRFGTASLSTPAGRVDVVTARRERYPHPGALPVVEPSRIEDDLARRDFTIHAMAIRLWPTPVEFLDPFGGRADLTARLIRVLHEGSFRDDATRALRAFRYAARLEFTVEPRTLELLRRDAVYLRRISPARLRRELLLMFEDERPEQALAQATNAGLLATLGCGLAWPAGVPEGAFATARDWRVALDTFGFCLLLASARPAHIDRAVRRLALAPRIATAVRAFRELVEAPSLTRTSVAPSAIAMLLDAAPPEAVAAAAFAAGDEIARRRCVRYLEEWRHVRPELDGGALAAMGFRGPEIGDTLQALRNARLDGVLASRADEERFARERLLKRAGTAPATGA